VVDEHLVDGRRDGDGRVAEAQQDLPVVEFDVIDGKANDPRHGLGIEQDQQRNQSVDELDAVVVVDPADEGEPLMLVHRRRDCTWNRREAQRVILSVAGDPDQERAQHFVVPSGWPWRASDRVRLG
jgi:hypothetical protein